MKTSELRSKSTEELNKELLALLKERFNLTMQKSTGGTSKPQLLKNVKLNIARIKTILHEKSVSK